VDVDIDNVDLEDTKTFELFQRGDTVAIFQYESTGMQKHLIDLVPNKFEDLIAMNALYRPGPMKYIPDFIARKHGRQQITYDLPEMEEYLAETYGITVYQEQVMLLSRKLGGFTRGQADALRKAMGKKKKALIDELKPKFFEGCKKNGHPLNIIEKIWNDWEAFASYAFNKSHATCYAYIAFQTAYLKAHYPAEFMAAVLNHNKKDISKLNFFLRECKRMNIEVLGPDINESDVTFSVNKKGQIRFGLSALKGVGEGPVNAIIKEREENGEYKDIYDLAKRLPPGVLNKKSLESLAYGGAFDSFGFENRAALFAPSNGYDTFLEALLKYGIKVHKLASGLQQSLFGDVADMAQEPPVPQVEPWSFMDTLEKEKNVTGIYIIGHPLDEFEYEIENFTNCKLSEVKLTKDVKVKVAGLVIEKKVGQNRRKVPYGRFTIQDYDGTLDFTLFNEDFQKFGNILEKGQVVYIEGVNQRGYNSDAYFFKVTNVKLMDTVGKALTKFITLTIPSFKITEVFINDFKTLINKHKGKHPLKVVITDDLGQNKLRLVSKKFKVNITNDFIQEIKRAGLSYKIN